MAGCESLFFFSSRFPLQLHVCSAEKKSFYGVQIFFQYKSLGILLLFFNLVSFYCLCGSQNVPVDKQGCVFLPPRCLHPPSLCRMISIAPTLPKSEGAATLRKSYIWKWEIYKASLLLFSLQSCIYVWKMILSPQDKKKKNCKEYLVFGGKMIIYES